VDTHLDQRMELDLTTAVSISTSLTPLEKRHAFAFGV